MSISVKTQKMLWGRAANRCAICRLELVMDASETDDESLVGEACHMVAASEGGPRGESPLTQEQRDKFANLLLLCNVHHKQIDDQPIAFPVAILVELKSDHEQWVRTQLNFDSQKQRDDEVYAGFVEEWANRTRLNDWNNWASGLLCNGQPSISAEMMTALENVRPWLLSRPWPHRYIDLESAFANFRHVTQDFCMTFSQHAEKWREDEWQTGKFYRIDDWNPELYAKRVKKFEAHVDLVCDLALELTRAANYVAEIVRRDLIHNYRVIEGVALIQSGPHMDMSYKTYRVEYRGEERTSSPYPGLEEFKKTRFDRDIHFGVPQHEL